MLFPFSVIGGTMKSFLDRVFYVTGVNNVSAKATTSFFSRGAVS
jgi:hypothetical protein